MTETTTSIPLNKLAAWDGNVRRTGRNAGLDELAASIAAHGLLQSLVVRKASRGKFAVVAGQRRLMALQRLADAGSLAADALVPCRVIANDTDATEISLAENVVREAMHPADEFDAFTALADAGTPVADIAARFGVSETVVLQRLKLARVSPKIVASYRAGDLTLQHVMAFAVSEDHAAQERVRDELADWQLEDPQTIRDALTDGEIPASDRRVRFVTLEAYEQAGGAVRRDLFTEGERGLLILDPLLLNRLVLEKLEAEAETVRAEGWKWVAVRDPFDYAEWSGCERRGPEPVPLPPEQQEELDRLTVEQDDLWNAADDDDAAARLEAVERRIAELEHGETFWPAETLAIAGAVLFLDHAGDVDVRRGYILPEDAPPKGRSSKRADAGPDGRPDPAALPASLVESLTAERSGALAAVLVENPRIALAATVHALALRVFYNTGRGTGVQLDAKPASLRLAEASKAATEIERHRALWAERLPGDPAALWAWCAEQGEFVLMDLLAFCAAVTLDAVTRKHVADDGRTAHADALATALGLDMAAWFTPTAENYFARIAKPQIIAAIAEAKSGPDGAPFTPAPAWAAMKKTELAQLAERETAGTGWLPAPLRKPA